MLDLTLGGQHEKAARLMRSGDLLEAAAVCHRILEAFPKYIGAYSLLGQVSLEIGEHEAAANLFRRVLSADPENTLAYASLSAIYAARGLLDEAIWSLERAFELSPSNQEIWGELLALYRERGASGLVQLKRSRGSLARTYLQGRLYPKAIGELRETVSAEPHRYDLRVALAVALWHNGQLQDAGVVCDGILADLPNCLKANLIAGAIWLNTEKDEEARALLQRAQALDPDNRVAQAIFGADSPLPLRKARLPFRKRDVPPLNLPYLDGGDQKEAKLVSIEGSTEKGVPRATTEASPERESDIPEILEAEVAATPDIAPIEEPAGFENPTIAGTITTETVQEEPESEQVMGAPPRDLGHASLLVIKQRYVAAHPDEHATRLELARLLRDVGDIGGSLEQYKLLIRPDLDLFPDVWRDLDLLNRLNPGNMSLLRLLAEVRGVPSQDPDDHKG